MINQRSVYLNDIFINIKSIGLGNCAIIFIHGSSINANTWLAQLQNKKLSDNYQLIAFDLPGHGQSEWLKKDPMGYRPRRLTALIPAIVREFKVKKYILVGLSYGTNIIGEIQTPLKGCGGIILLSPCIINDFTPVASILTPGANGHVISASNPSDKDLHAFAFEHMKNKEIALRFVDTYRKTDPEFRVQLSQSLFEGEFTDEIENIKKLNVPVCIIFGKNESLLKNDYLNNFKPLWQQQIFLIDDASHLANEENPEAFNSLLLSFADYVFK